jgi:hypothetical protein
MVTNPPTSQNWEKILGRGFRCMKSIAYNDFNFNFFFHVQYFGKLVHMILLNTIFILVIIRLVIVIVIKRLIPHIQRYDILENLFDKYPLVKIN